jgi:hypothetical protein
VSAESATPLSYQWQKNGGNLSDGGDVSGTVTDTLEIVLCDSSDQGNYRCLVSNDYGSVTSNSATLTVSGPPVVPGDFNDDSDVDQEDFGHLQICLTGTGGGSPAPGCEDANLDGDNDVDGNDAVKFLQCMSAANVWGDPDCAR